MRSRARFAAAPLVLLAALALGGCTLVGSGGAAKPTNTLSSALSALVPVYPATLTAAAAKKNTIRAADAIQGLIANTEIVHVDDQSKLVAATTSTGEFYGVERAVTTKTGFGVVLQAQAMEKLLVQAGWVSRNFTSSTAGYSVALTTRTAAGASVLLLQADAAPGVAPAILLELESPDLPAK